MTSFYWTCFSSAKHILRALALGIGLSDENHLLNYHSGDYNQLRLLHYPSIPANAVEGGKFARMPAHTDWSTMTMLFQDDCGGLQVESPKQPGEFIDVPPIPGTCVMNVGDLLTRWSNDYLKSTSHRVQLPPRQDRYTGDERLTRARYSIPYFLTTDPDTTIECLEGRFEGGEKAKYEPITQREYAAMRARMQY
jgi:isopenicillin N synthase-like dioxygenase